MLKTIEWDDFYFLREILQDYFYHLKDNKDSLITWFFGMHKVKYEGKKWIYFIIMANVFNTDWEIHQRFDLKGSTKGWLVPPDQV